MPCRGMIDEPTCFESPVFPIVMTIAPLVDGQQDNGSVYIFPSTGAINLVKNAFFKVLLPGQEKEVRPQSSSTTDALRRTTGGTKPALTSL